MNRSRRSTIVFLNARHARRFVSEVRANGAYRNERRSSAPDCAVEKRRATTRGRAVHTLSGLSKSRNGRTRSSLSNANTILRVTAIVILCAVRYGPKASRHACRFLKRNVSTTFATASGRPAFDQHVGTDAGHGIPSDDHTQREFVFRKTRYRFMGIVVKKFSRKSPITVSTR